MTTKKEQQAKRLAFRRALAAIVRRFPELTKARTKRRLERYVNGLVEQPTDHSTGIP